MRRSSVLAGAVLLAVLPGALSSPLGAQSAPRRAAAERLGLSLDVLERLHDIRGLSDEALSLIPAELIPWMLLRLRYPNFVQWNSG